MSAAGSPVVPRLVPRVVLGGGVGEVVGTVGGGLECQAVGAELPKLVGGSPRLVGEPGAGLVPFISGFGGVRDQISCPEYCAQNVCVCVCV